MRPRGRPCPHGRTPASARTHGRVRADAPCFILGNFKKDATVRPSHGRPCGHRPTVRKRPRDNPGVGNFKTLHPGAVQNHQTSIFS
jgi:hypothetical protein